MTVNQTRLVELTAEQLQVNPYQMRRVFGEAEIAELAESITQNGLIQPIIVRAISADRYQIVAGERRWRASQQAGLEYIPCLLRAYSDQQVAAAATVENVNRVDLNPIEEAEAYRRLADDFAYSHEEISSIVGKSRSKITNCMRLLRLDNSIQDDLISGEITEGHAKLLLSFPRTEQLIWLDKIKQGAWSVRNLENEINNEKNKKTAASAPMDPNLQRLQQKISQRLGCSVNINHNKKGTKLEINCHNLDILQGVLEKMDCQVEDL